MANTPKDESTKGRKQSRKAAFRNKAAAERSEAKWFNPEPREEASTALPTTPTPPYGNTRLQQGEGHPGALAAGAASDTGDKSRNVETSRHADRLEPEPLRNRGLGADSGLTQNRRAGSSGVTHLGSAPYQGTGEAPRPGAGSEAGAGGGPAGSPGQRAREVERDASLDAAASSGIAPAEALGVRSQGHPGRAARKGAASALQEELPLPQPPTQEAGSPGGAPGDMRDRQARAAGVDTRGLGKQKTSEGPNAPQTLKRGAGDDTPRN